MISGDVPMGGELGEQLAWQSWPSSNVYDYFIRRDIDPDALEELQTAIAAFRSMPASRCAAPS